MIDMAHSCAQARSFPHIFYQASTDSLECFDQGSNSVSVASVTAAHAIYASSSAMSKAAAYSDVRGGLKGQGLFSMRTKEESAARKRIWTRAFSTKRKIDCIAVDDDELIQDHSRIDAYQPILVKRTEQLLDTIIDRKEPDKSIALSTYLRYWAFDISVRVVLFYPDLCSEQFWIGRCDVWQPKGLCEQIYFLEILSY